MQRLVVSSELRHIYIYSVYISLGGKGLNVDMKQR
jgi:hypothetical protein